jgi:ubiquinone/menaquinone biosynthesis C-methylase UbiE
MDGSNKKKIRRTIDFYNGFSEKYDRKYAAYLEHTHRHLLDHIGDLSGKKVLDVSCGTGILAKHLFEMFPDIKLHLNDPSEGMRSVAMARFENYSEVEFSNKPAEDLHVEPDSYDSVICLNSFHYYADQKMAIENMRGALKPGGTLYLLDWNLEGWFHIPNKIIALLSRENINTRSRPETEDLLKESGLKPVSSKRWSYRFWKFYMIEAKKVT